MHKQSHYGDSFIVIGADTPWVIGLCEALTHFQAQEVKALRFVSFDRYLKSFNKRRVVNGRMTQIAIPVPPSYGTRLLWITKPYLTSRLQSEFIELSKKTKQHIWVVLTNPIMERLTKNIPDDQLIYWNYDDYRLYQPQRTKEIESWEDVLIERARIVLCAARTQQLRFHKRFPQWSKKIIHFPNAVKKGAISLKPFLRKIPFSVSYVGNMGDRVDWKLVYEIISLSPQMRFIFVGGIEEEVSNNSPEWVIWRGKALSLENVESVGYVPQNIVMKYYQSCAVNWMPYDTKHKFNIASCPTKIFDALASGRPFVSTAVPECLLYPEYIDIFGSAEEGSHALALAVEENDVRLTTQRICFAKKNDWHARADRLLRLLRER